MTRAAGREGGEDGAGPLRRSVPIVLGVVAASVVVAIGAGGAGLLVPPADLGEGSARTVRLLGAVAMVLGFAVLLVQRRRQRWNRVREPDPTGAAIRNAAVIMGALVLVALLAPAVGPGADPGSMGGEGAVIDPDASALETAPPPSAAPPGFGGSFGLEDRMSQLNVRQSRPRAVAAGEAAGRSRLQLLGMGLLLILLVALLILAFLALTGRLGDREEAPPDEPVSRTEAEAGLTASLEEAGGLGSDPRGRVTAAYRRLLAALAAAGAPRQPQEAPHEHLHRTLGPLGIRAGPMHRLAALYVVAQFSDRTMTEDHRLAAVEALEASLADLRATRTANEPVPVEAGFAEAGA